MRRMTGTLHVAKCPLLPTWASDPLESEEAAREAGRAHLVEHSHAELVDFTARAIEVVRYVKETPE